MEEEIFLDSHFLIKEEILEKETKIKSEIFNDFLLDCKKEKKINTLNYKIIKNSKKNNFQNFEKKKKFRKF